MGEDKRSQVDEIIISLGDVEQDIVILRNKLAKISISKNISGDEIKKDIEHSLEQLYAKEATLKLKLVSLEKHGK